MLLTSVPTFFLLTFLFFSNSTLPFAHAARSLIDVLSSDGRFGYFLEALQEQRLIDDINNYPIATIFAPAGYMARTEKLELSRETLLYHILFEKVELDEFHQGQLLTTRLVKQGRLGEGDGLGQMIRVDKEGNFTYIGNARIINEFTLPMADNGIIHPIDAVLKTPVQLFDTSKYFPQSQIFTGYLVKSGLEELLKEVNHATMFVPTNDAITSRLARHERKYLVGECGSGPGDLDMIVKHHIYADGVLYSRNVIHPLDFVSTLQGEPIKIRKYPGGRIGVGSGNITSKDVLAENGVIHTVNDISLPYAFRLNELKYLCGLDAINFVQSILGAGLSGYIENSIVPYSILAPRDGTSSLGEDNNENKNSLKYHFVKGKFEIDDLSNGMNLKTALSAGSLNGNPQRIKVSIIHDEIKFNNVSVIGEPVSIGKSIIYILSHSLTRPVGISRTLSRYPELDLFVKAISTNDPGRVFLRPGITVFSPTTKAFEKLGPIRQYFFHPMGQEDFYSVLKHHVLDETLYVEDIQSGEHHYKTIEGTTVSLERRGDVILFKGQDSTSQLLEQRDVLVENGVVHLIDAVQLPPTFEVTPLKILIGMRANTMLKIFNLTGFTWILTERTSKFTILLPPEEELEKLNFLRLANDRYRLTRFLESHIIRGAIPEFKDGEELQTLSSKKIVIKWNNTCQKYYFEFDKVVNANILEMSKTSSGGAVYYVDKVLQRSPMQNFSGLSALPTFVCFTIGGGLLLHGIQKSGVGEFLALGGVIVQYCGMILWTLVQQFVQYCGMILWTLVRRWDYEPIRDGNDESDAERGAAGFNQAASENQPILTSRKNQETGERGSNQAASENHSEWLIVPGESNGDQFSKKGE